MNRRCPTCRADLLDAETRPVAREDDSGLFTLHFCSATCRDAYLDDCDPSEVGA